MAFLAYLLFAVVTAHAAFRDFETLSAWFPANLMAQVDPYGYLKWSDIMATVFVGALFVTFAISPWVRLKLLCMLDVWHRRILAIIISVILLAVLFALMFATLILTDISVYNTLLENDPVSPFSIAERENLNFLFGFSKASLLRLAEVIILVVPIIIFYIPVNIGFMYFYRDDVIPWLQGHDRKGRVLSSQAVFAIISGAWVISIVIAMWQLDVINLYVHMEPAVLSDIPIGEGKWVTKQEILVFVELILTPFITAALLWANFSLIKSIFWAVSSCIAIWPQTEKIEGRYRKPLYLGIILIVMVPLFVHFIPIAQAILGR